MNSLLEIRPMRPVDLPSISEIEVLCYTEIAPESDECLLAKLSASPSTCYVACQQHKVVAYLISLPGSFEHPPELHAVTCELPPNPDTLYLHDLAVSPNARGTGAGKALVERFITRAKELNFKHASLIAVQGSKTYWERYGFRPIPQTGALKAKLASYGDNAEYMEAKIR